MVRTGTEKRHLLEGFHEKSDNDMIRSFLSKEKTKYTVKSFSRYDSTLDRFWIRVEFTTDCWNWIGTLNFGYGKFYVNNKPVFVHRFSYELVNGKIPQNMVLDHLCRNRKCVNPDHLEVVTQRTNILRGIGLAALNSRKTHCYKGHLLKGNNLYMVTEGKYIKRQCRTSRIKRSKNFREGKKELILLEVK